MGKPFQRNQQQNLNTRLSTRPSIPKNIPSNIRDTIYCPNPECSQTVPQEPPGGRFVTCTFCGYRYQRAAHNRGASFELSNPELKVSPSTNQIRIVLVDIRSLQNVGSIFRTSAAFGLQEIILCGITGGPPRSQISKVALGAEAMIPWRYRLRPEPLLEELQAQNNKIILFDVTSNSLPMDSKTKSKAGTVLVFGHETEGLSKNLLDCYGPALRIPHAGPKQSLNVSIAAAIAIHWAVLTE